VRSRSGHKMSSRRRGLNRITKTGEGRNGESLTLLERDTPRDELEGRMGAEKLTGGDQTSKIKEVTSAFGGHERPASRKNKGGRVVQPNLPRGDRARGQRQKT